jgi:biofilm PGA synthesis N-glycosyltransferase PgaC
MARADALPLRRRVARLGVLTAVLFVLALMLVALTVLIVLSIHSNAAGAELPLPERRAPGATTLLAVGAAAVAAFVLLAALHAAAAMRVLARDRRIPPPLPSAARRLRTLLLTQLGPAAVRLTTVLDLPPSQLVAESELIGKTLRLTVLVPAHDEALTIEATLDSLFGQTRPPDRVIVVADNCTDNTAELALAKGAEVISTVGNSEKKAGALNQVLSELLTQIDKRDVTMVMDADSVIASTFVEIAMGRLESDPDLIAVGGIFTGEPGSGLVGQLQRSEYTRYQRYLARRLGKVFVLTGTASLFRSYALKAVAEARGDLIPGDPHQVYDTRAMTEDNELTMALKSLGAKMVSPMQCIVVTEVMPDWTSLWRQRMRWQRGGLENIGAYGPTRATFRHWMQQLGIGYGTLALNAYLLLLLITVLSADQFVILWFWFAIGLIFVVERVVTVWAGGWRARLIALPLVIELVYAVFLQAVYVVSLVEIATGRAAGWNYVPRQEAVTE